MTDFATLVPRPHRPVRRRRAPLLRRRRPDAARIRPDRAHAGPARRGEAVGAVEDGGLHQRAGRAVRQPGHADGARRAEGDLPVRLAGRGRRQHGRCAMYPDQSLYPANAGPELCRRINRTLQRADQIEHSEGGAERDWFAPIVADAEAGFGGPLNCFEIMKAYIEAGAAGVHFEDQLASREEVRPPGRQGADPDPGAHPQPRLRAPGRRRHGRAHRHLRAHRRGVRQADHQRRGRARRRVPDGRAHAGGILPAEGRHGRGSLHQPRPGLRSLTPICCGGRRPSPTWTTPAASPRRSRPNIRTRCWPTTARPHSIGKPIWTRTPSPDTSASWARWGTSSSS